MNFEREDRIVNMAMVVLGLLALISSALCWGVR